jgi:methyl-accepting chemotaxis protein
MLKKFGLQKYIVIIVISLIVINIATSLFTLMTVQKNNKLQIEDLRDTSSDSSTIINLSINFSTIQSLTSSLLVEKDPDNMEKVVGKIASLMKVVEETDLKKCDDCKSIQNNFKAYKTKSDELINKKILLGKTAEAIEYYIGDVSPIFMQTLVELEKKRNEIDLKAKNSILSSQRKAEELNKAIGFASLLLIVLIIAGGANFKKSMAGALADISENLKINTQALKETSIKVAHTSDFLSGASLQQNTLIQSTSQAVHQISAMTDTNKKNVSESTESAGESQIKITKGKEVISDMLSSMENISTTNDDMITQIKKNGDEFSEVIKLIKEIDSKTKIINDIVFQTKLLSFNASVEAARAGANGKGFAVVAEEVGNLAVMSGKAALEISNLLHSSVKRVDEIVIHSQESMEKIVEIGRTTIEEGKQRASDCNEIFDLISKDSNHICSILMDINSGTIEQSRGIEEVNKSMLQLNEVANKGEQIAQESLQMSTKLKEQSEVLDRVVTELAGKSKWM